jgi:SAM-dependent methyltransferase
VSERREPGSVPEAMRRKRHDPTAYGAGLAEDYDELYEHVAVEPIVDLIARLIGDGPALELGVGTGRLAIPLSRRGFEVDGIEGSKEMIDALRAKPDGSDLKVTQGDFSEVDGPGGPYSLAYITFNTIFALPGVDEQIRCFERVARQLRDGGRFVIEAFVLQPANFQNGRSVQARAMSEDRLELEISEYDPVSQQLNRVFVNVVGGDIRLHSANDAYASPRELDLMSRAAGLTLESRWADWERSRFDRHSTGHVSVYRKNA